MNPLKTHSWKKLQETYQKRGEEHLLDFFDRNPNRFKGFTIETNELLFDFSKHNIDDEILESLIDLAKEQNLDAAKNEFFNGDKINQTENRAVLHTALRAPANSEISVDGVNVVPQVHEVLQKIEKFTNKVVNGEFKGYSGQPITDIVNIGIGGSDLGPKMAVNALRKYHNHLHTHYVSNVDVAAIENVLEKVNLETTLFIIVSKTFTTIETLTNAQTARQAIVDHFNDDKAVANHFVAVSTNQQGVSQFGIDTQNMFEFWDWVGGRYSMWSAVGLSISLSIGFKHFHSLLQGAHEADLHFKNQPDKNNIPVIMALLDIWYNNFFNYRSLAVIPYSEDLSYFPKFLQQLDMESNGKCTDKDGERVNYKTSNVVWGEAGTDSQHSFFQLLHQGTDIIPVDFIGVKKNDMTSKHDKILMSNFLAQSKALMEGTVREKLDADDKYAKHKYFEGNRPSTSIVLKGLTPHNLGFLTALYEHKVFVQGILWNVFSFDQWGVQLGKKLATSIGNLNENELNKLDASTRGLYNFFNK